ncbi:MAG: helix-turn-helix transcriptional regulator [Solobacterium sp.]|nr:helix-turn-helix transcriptional regulator [Solobacterium sp.]
MKTTVGEKIRYARKASNVNRSALGRSVGTIYQRIREWEDGINHPKYENVKKIADSLKVDVRYFMDPEVSPEDFDLYRLESQDYVDVRLSERAAAYVRSIAEKKKSSAAQVVNDIIESMIRK